MGSTGITTVSSQEQQENWMPTRHPRPPTAAELHLELEKEQEAVVSATRSKSQQMRVKTDPSRSRSRQDINSPLNGAHRSLTILDIKIEANAIYEEALALAIAAVVAATAAAAAATTTPIELASQLHQN